VSRLLQIAAAGDTAAKVIAAFDCAGPVHRRRRGI